MTEQIKRSKVEEIKELSVYLKGNVVEELADSNPYVSDESYELLKFHGSYQGYDRDTATERKKAGLEKDWEFMLRMKCPGGRLTPAQYLAIDGICDDYANGTMRITTRQTFQFHCIVKGDLKPHIAALNALAITTLGGCGDVVRNVICTAAPKKDEVHERMLADVYRVAKFTDPKTSAYHEIWLDGENVVRVPENETLEPLYGKQYMPRKFKISVSVPEDNSVDAMTHDLAIILIYEGKKFIGYNICVGGGLGMTHNKPETYPRLATPIAFVGPDDLLKAVEAVIKLQRDHGDREDRKHARLKYVVEENGIEWTKKTLDEYYGSVLAPAKPMAEFKIPDLMGWHEQGDGKWFLGVPVDSGRIKDDETTQIRSAFRDVVKTFGPNVVLSSDQNLIFADIDAAKKDGITAMLKKYGVKLREDITEIHRYFLACVALPTCGKALAEAERVKLPLVDTIEQVMNKHGILKETISIRIAGCPNGCSRPYVADIALVGRMPDNYALFVGGNFEGTRLNSKILDRLPYESVAEVFDILFAHYVANRQSGEGYGNFADRIGVKTIGELIASTLGEKYKWAKAA